MPGGRVGSDVRGTAGLNGIGQLLAEALSVREYQRQVLVYSM